MKETPSFAPGYDLVSVVDEVGEGVTKIKIGQKVAELTVIGAYSEYICLPENRLVPVLYVTVYQMLHQSAKIQKGQRILIHGAFDQNKSTYFIVDFNKAVYAAKYTASLS